MATPPKQPTDTESKRPATDAAAPPTPPATPRKGAAAANTPAEAPMKAKPAKAPAPRKPAKPRPTTATRVAASTPTKARKAPGKTRAVATPNTKPASRWGKVTLVGGIAALGAAVTAALFALRSSTPRAEKLNPGAHAHQADGTDSSASFEAGIADEGTVPE